MKKEIKKLYRAKETKIAGVCGGIADYLGVDPTLIRVVWILLTGLSGSGVLAYIIAWIIMPQRPNETERLELGEQLKH